MKEERDKTCLFLLWGDHFAMYCAKLKGTVMDGHLKMLGEVPFVLLLLLCLLLPLRLLLFLHLHEQTDVEL